MIGEYSVGGTTYAPEGTIFDSSGMQVSFNMISNLYHDGAYLSLRASLAMCTLFL